jgi:hypothetical protein
MRRARDLSEALPLDALAGEGLFFLRADLLPEEVL